MKEYSLIFVDQFLFLKVNFLFFFGILVIGTLWFYCFVLSVVLCYTCCCVGFRVWCVSRFFVVILDVLVKVFLICMFVLLLFGSPLWAW